jgi:inositol oxygenase
MSAVVVAEKRSLAESESTDVTDSKSSEESGDSVEETAVEEGSIIAQPSLTKKMKVASTFISKKKTPEEFRDYTTASPCYARVSAFYKEQHEKQTYAFAVAAKAKYATHDRCEKGIWEMVERLNEVIDDSDPDTDLSQLHHAIQTAEAARRLMPDEKYDWFHVAAFIHDLGKVIAIDDPKLGFEGEPQWATVGDNFPVGCAFDKAIIFHEFFEPNPDSKDERYNSEHGIYEPNCGLMNVTMSFSHDEYMYGIAKEQSSLPIEALYVLRFHSFYAFHQCESYKHLCDEQDLKMLEWLKRFQKCDLYSKAHDLPPVEEVQDYYQAKILKYFPDKVKW